MARRSYGNTTVSDEETVASQTVVEPPKEEKPKKERKPLNMRAIRAWLIVITIVAFVISSVLLYRYIRYDVYDNGYGFDSPEELVVTYFKSYGEEVVSINTAPYKDAKMTFLPGAVRNRGYGADNAHMNDLSRYDELYGVSFDSVQMVTDTPTDASDKITSFEQGLQDVYGVSVDIKEACIMPVVARMRYTIDEQEYVQDIEMNIPCIKCGSGKWYLYSGTPYENLEAIELTKESKVASTEEEAPTPTDVPVMEQRQEIEKVIPEIDPYDGAIDDLKAGNVGINGVACVMPMDYTDTLDIGFQADEDAILQEDRMVSPNWILKNLPVRFKSSDYDYMECRMDVGNVSDKTADISDCIVTTLYLGVPNTENMDYFDVCLPGNITFGSTLNDVKEVYGADNLVYIKDSSSDPILDPPSEAEIQATRTSYDKYTVTVDGKEQEMNEDEFNEYVQTYSAKHEQEVKDYEKYLAFLNQDPESDIILHSPSAHVYRVDIDEHNKIYLEFENYELVAIEWYYYDLSSFKTPIEEGDESND